MAALRRPFLGTGWKFPLQVTPTGAIATSSEEQKIEESILLVLSTAPGERLMLPDFGCAIHDLVFEPNNSSTVTTVIDLVRRSLTEYEPRIDVIEVTAETSTEQQNLLLIRVDYRVRDNNAMANLVYPFFITEGV
ncbi:MAG: GPW/gp25 family protein [Deltaproteobacteria bacterium]